MSHSARWCAPGIVTGVAAWLATMSPVLEAQLSKSHPEPPAEAGDSRSLKGPPRVTLLRLHLVKPEPPHTGPRARFPRPMGFGNQAVPREGTTLTFLVDEPNRLIQSVRTKECRLTRLTDDRGTNLLENLDAAQGNGLLPPGVMEPTFEADVDPGGHRATVTIHSAQLPASGANTIRIEASLVLAYLQGEKQVEQKNVNLKLDKITTSPFPMIIASLSDEDEMMGLRQGTRGNTGCPVPSGSVDGGERHRFPRD